MRQIALRLVNFATLLVCLCLFSSVQAQNELDATFVSEDGSLRFQYPGDWYIHERDDGLITFIEDPVSVLIISPNQFAQMGGEVEQEATLREAMMAYISLTPFETETPTVVTLASGAKVMRANFTSDEAGFEDVTAAFVLAVPVGDEVVFVLASGKNIDSDELEPVPYAVAETLEVGEFSLPGSVSGELPVLVDYGTGSSGSDWEPAIAELEALELIPSGGELIYAEELLNTAFNPGLQLDPDSASESTDFVMGARLSFRPVENGGTPLCGLISRATENSVGELENFLAVLVTPADTIAVIEQITPGEEPFFYETDFVTQFYGPQHLMFIARGNHLTVFVNGEAVIENLPLNFSAEAEDTISYFVGTNMDNSCVMTGAWAYALPE